MHQILNIEQGKSIIAKQWMYKRKKDTKIDKGGYELNKKSESNPAPNQAELTSVY